MFYRHFASVGISSPSQRPWQAVPLRPVRYNAGPPPTAPISGTITRLATGAGFTRQNCLEGGGTKRARSSVRASPGPLWYPGRTSVGTVPKRKRKSRSNISASPSRRPSRRPSSAPFANALQVRQFQQQFIVFQESFDHTDHLLFQRPSSSGSNATSAVSKWPRCSTSATREMHGSRCRQ